VTRVPSSPRVDAYIIPPLPTPLAVQDHVKIQERNGFYSAPGIVERPTFGWTNRHIYVSIVCDDNIYLRTPVVVDRSVVFVMKEALESGLHQPRIVLPYSHKQ